MGCGDGVIIGENAFIPLARRERGDNYASLRNYKYIFGFACFLDFFVINLFYRRRGRGSVGAAPLCKGRALL